MAWTPQNLFFSSFSLGFIVKLLLISKLFLLCCSSNALLIPNFSTSLKLSKVSTPRIFVYEFEHFLWRFGDSGPGDSQCLCLLLWLIMMSWVLPSPIHDRSSSSRESLFSKSESQKNVFVGCARARRPSRRPFCVVCLLAVLVGFHSIIHLENILNGTHLLSMFGPTSRRRRKNPGEESKDEKLLNVHLFE